MSEYLDKNLLNCLTNGPIGVLVPLIINKLENPSEIFSKLANLLLSNPYMAVTMKKETVDDKKEPTEKKEENNEHLIENSVSHLTLKHIFNDEKHVESRNLTSKTNFKI